MNTKPVPVRFRREAGPAEGPATGVRSLLGALAALLAFLADDPRRDET